MNEKHVPDYYLVLTGPKDDSVTSRGMPRPWLIEEAFLFDADGELENARSRGVKIGVATSVPSSRWDAARIFTRRSGGPLTLADDQVRMLALFGG